MTHVYIDRAPLSPTPMVVRAVKLPPFLRVIYRFRLASWVIERAVRRALQAEAQRAYGFDLPEEEMVAQARQRYADISKHLD